MNMTIKASVYIEVLMAGKGGITVPEFLESFPDMLPQTVYPCFTQLYRSKKILDSRQRRKSKNNRRSIVWVDERYGGVIPVWGSGHPSYSYRNRAKIVMDLLFHYGPLSVSEMMTASSTLKPMSTSSLVSCLVKQQWLHKTIRTRVNQIHQTCCLYALTPRGMQIRSGAPNKELTRDNAPKINKGTEKTRG